MTVKRLVLAGAAAAGLFAAASTAAVAQEPGQLSYEETRRCVAEGQRLDKELPALNARRPELERQGAQVNALAEEVEELRRRSTAVFNRQLSREYEAKREQHYQAYERYTREMTEYNQRVADYNNALTAYNTDCAPSKLYGLYIERAERELGIR